MTRGVAGTVAEHGTQSRYNNHGCRCDACRDAHRDYYRARYGHEPSARGRNRRGVTTHDVPLEVEYGPEERMQLYVVDAQGERRQLATAADMEAIGVAIRCMGEEGELDGMRVGILDRAERKWVLNPWAQVPPLHV